MFEFTTQGTCSKKIFVELDGKKIKSVDFEGGCNGNLKAISRLVEGEDVDKVIDRLKGVTCGFRETSCGDQFARALEESKNK